MGGWWCAQVRVDLSEEKVRELEAKAQKEKDELQRKAKQVRHMGRVRTPSVVGQTDRLLVHAACLRRVLPPVAVQDIEDLVRAQAKTVEEREVLRQRLQKEAEDRASILEQKSMLQARNERARGLLCSKCVVLTPVSRPVVVQDKLKAMQEKLIQGGEILDKAAKQEAMLRKARLDLDEQEAQKLR